MDSGVLQFGTEKARDLKDEIQPLLAENWKDVQGGYPDSTLGPKYEFYFGLEDAGALRIFTARVDGRLAGYAIVFLTTHPHREDDLVGSIDSLFVLREFRHSESAKRLLHFAEETLRVLGVYSLTMVARYKRLERWLGMAGYTQVETVWERRL